MNFVVDGAHRLGALIAWLQDDYGDGATSRHFFGEALPDEQKRVADRARKLVQKTIGSYHEVRHAISNPDTSNPDYVKTARSLSARALTIQWVDGDAKKVEESFKKINQKAAPIDQTELILIDNRRRPNAIASRAIHHRGSGNEYWKNFPDGKRLEIETSSAQVFDILFKPDDREYIKNFNAPIGGMVNSAQALPMVFSLVNTANEVVIPSDPEEDKDGLSTVKYIKYTLKVVRKLGGVHPSSLGLHPFVYFYSPTGKHQTILFHAMVGFVASMDTEKLVEFCKARRNFEDFIVAHKTLLSQIVRKYGSKESGRNNLEKFYGLLVKAVKSSADVTDVIGKLLEVDRSFSFLQPAEGAEGVVHSKEFSSDTKAAGIIRENIRLAVRCAICGGFLPPTSITVDHITDKRAGGIGKLDNAQLAHPFCNSTVKDRI